MVSWRRLYIEEFQKIYASPNIIRVIKSRKMSWTNHLTRIGKVRKEFSSLVGKPEGKT
jgi:hypothetical protein